MHKLKAFILAHSPFLKLERWFFFLTIIFLPTQIGKHFWPDFAYIYSIRTDYFSPVVYVWDLLVLIFLLISVFKGNFKFKQGLTLLLIFWMSQIGSFFLSVNLGASFVRFEQYLLIGLWGLYIGNDKTREAWSLLWWGLGLGLLWSSILGIGQFLVGKSLGFWVMGERSFSLDTISIATFDWYNQIFLRPYATFPHPNVFAAFLLLGIIVFEFLRLKRKVKYNWFFMLVVIFSATALFLTFSRVAIGLFIVVLIYFFRTRFKLLGLLVGLMLPFLYVRYHSAFNFDQLSVLRREELATASLNLWKSSPFLGIGLNNYIAELARGGIVSGGARFLQPVHMIFLLTLAETGLLGLMGLFVLLKPMFQLFKIIITKRKNLEILLLCYAWVCVMVMGLFDHFFLTLAQGLRMFFLLWGITVLQYYCEYAKKSR